MTEKELFEQERKRIRETILTPENVAFMKEVYNAIWGTK